MLALRDYGQQACEFWIGKPSGLAHGNLTKGRDWLLFMMFPLSLPRDQRLQTARKPKDRGRLRRFREPNKIHIMLGSELAWSTVPNDPEQCFQAWCGHARSVIPSSTIAEWQITRAAYELDQIETARR